MDPVKETTLRRWLKEHPGVDRYGDPLPRGARTRLGTCRLRHDVKIGNAGVSSLAFSPDGKHLAAAGREDGRISLWEVSSGKLVRMLEQKNSARIHSVAFSSDGKLLASGGDDERVRLWDPHAGKQLREFKGDWISVEAVAFSPNGKLLASANFTCSVCVWNLASGKLRLELKGEKSPVGDVFGHEDHFHSVCFSPNGKLLAAGSGFESLVQMSRAERQRFQKERAKRFGTCGTASDGKKTYVVVPTGRAWLWSLPDGEPLSKLVGHEGAVNGLSITPDSKTLISSSWDNTVRMWDLASGRQVRKIQCGDRAIFMAPVALSPDGKTVAIPAPQLSLYEVPSANCRLTVEKPFSCYSAFAVAFAPDGETLASAHQSGSIDLWNVRSGEEVNPMPRHYDWAQNVTFSPDSQKVASVANLTIMVWQADTGRELARIKNVSLNLPPKFAPNGKAIATAGDFEAPGARSKSGVFVWDVVSGNLLLELAKLKL